jgi:hypothetical protein
MEASEDFMSLIIVHAHVVAAARTIQDLGAASTVDDITLLIVVNYLLLPLTPSWVDQVYTCTCVKHLH